MDPEALLESYQARPALYTEHDFVRRFAQIKNARASSISGIPTARAPADWMIALLASGRVSDAEYFRLAEMLGVDSSGLIRSEAPAERGFGEQLLAAWRALARFVSTLRRA
jgi:hypothetical protein